MSDLDPLLLSRIQFAFTISFHIIFPAFTIGLASFLAFIEGLWLKTNHPFYKEIYLFWVKIFAVSFAMGVVSGIVLSYQFGTNWSVFSDKVGNVLGPLMSFEVMTAFFLEASFLGVMLFGWQRVSAKMHFFATLMVALGTLISAFWILSANSWMHTPAGYTINDAGIFFPADWLAIIFNPSFPYRFIHMVLAAYLTTAFVVAGVASWYLLKKQYSEHARAMLVLSIGMAAVLTPLQIVIGDFHGLNTLTYQPAKIAAMEGLWETERGAPFKLFGIPNTEREVTEYAIDVPGLASLILTHDWGGEVKGLKAWPKEERPDNVPGIFYAFRMMVSNGILMLLTAWFGAYLYWRKQLFTTTWFQQWCVFITPIGFVSILAGWFVTEVGRQPYIVNGLLKTADVLSPIAGTQVLTSLLAFVFVYSIVFSAGVYYILRLVKKGITVGSWVSNFNAHDIFPGAPKVGPSYV